MKMMQQSPCHPICRCFGRLVEKAVQTEDGRLAKEVAEELDWKSSKYGGAEVEECCSCVEDGVGKCVEAGMLKRNDVSRAVDSESFCNDRKL